MVKARKYDGRVSKSWRAELLESSADHILLGGVFDVDVDHSHLGHLKKGTISYEYYWQDRWYSIFRFHEPEGSLRNYYCNINMPPEFSNGVLDYVDLDIDIVVWGDGRVVTLDEDEFTANAALFQYPESVLENAARALDELRSMISKREYPFHDED